jgi:hypothetical protein
VCALVLQAKIQCIRHIEHARVLRAQVEDRIARRPRALVDADADAEGVPVPQRHFVEIRPTRSLHAPSPAWRGEEALTIGESLRLFAGIRPETQPVSAPPEDYFAFLLHRSIALLSPQSQRPKHIDEEVALNDFLEFFHGIAFHARAAAGGYQPTDQVSPSFGELGSNYLI